MQFFPDSEHTELRSIFDKYLGKNVMDVLKVNENKIIKQNNRMYMIQSYK